MEASFKKRVTPTIQKELMVKILGLTPSSLFPSSLPTFSPLPTLAPSSLLSLAPSSSPSLSPSSSPLGILSSSPSGFPTYVPSTTNITIKMHCSKGTIISISILWPISLIIGIFLSFYLGKYYGNKIESIDNHEDDILHTRETVETQCETANDVNLDETICDSDSDSDSCSTIFEK